MSPSAEERLNASDAPARDASAGSDASLRLFVALWPPASMRARFADFADAWHWPPGARRVADAHLHATLHFIGPFGVDRLDLLRTTLDGVAPRPIGLAAAGTAVWSGGIAVVTLAADAALDALHRDIGEALERLGIALDRRPFAPHVTLARKAAGAVPPLSLPPELAWRATGFGLAVSRRGPPVRYERLVDWGGDGPGR